MIHWEIALWHIGNGQSRLRFCACASGAPGADWSGVEKHLTLVRQYPVGPGGAERYLELLVRGLTERGFEITLLCADAPPHKVFSDTASVDVVRLDIPNLSRWRPLRAWYFPWLVQSWLKKYPQPFVFSLERNWRQDLLRSGDGIHVEWLQRRRALRHDALNWLTAISPYHRLSVMCERRAYNPERTLWVLANSNFVREQIVSRFRFPAGRTEVIHNGVDLERWSPEADPWLRARLGLSAETALGLFVGTGWERKGLGEACDALAAWSAKSGRPTHLAVAGRGPGRKYRGPNVTFFGTIGHAELQRFYRGADFLLLPTWYDPFANVTLEALASGLPVITTRANGAAEILDEGIDGAVVESPRDRGAMVEKIGLFADAAKREEVRGACRRKAEQYGLADHVGKVIQLCMKVAALKG